MSLHPDPITIAVQLPSMPEKPEWKLDGSIIAVPRPARQNTVLYPPRTDQTCGRCRSPYFQITIGLPWQGHDEQCVHG